MNEWTVKQSLFFHWKNPYRQVWDVILQTFLCLSNPMKLNGATQMQKVNHVIENIVLSTAEHLVHKENTLWDKIRK